MTIEHQEVAPGLPEQNPTIMESQAYFKKRTLGTLKSLATQSGEPVDGLLAEALKAYKRKYGESEDQRSVTGIGEVEAYQSIVAGKGHQEALDVLGDILEPAAWEVLGKGVKELFWDRVNAAYRALRADPAAWGRELQERRAWDATLLDGLEDA